MMRLMVGAAVALAAWGCASGGGAAPPEGGLRDLVETGNGGTGGRDASHIAYGSADMGEQAVLPAPIDSAYASLLMSYQSLGLQIKTSDPAQHVLGNRHIVVMRTWLGSRLSTFFNCGNDPALGTPRADSYQLIISVVSTLSAKDANSTTITTLTTAQANDLATSASSVYCSSTGKLERTLLKAAGFQPN
jgi:hypothetical protein